MDVGDRITLSVTFTDSTGTPTDPTAVTLTVYLPTDSETGGTAYTPTNTATGVYTYAYTPTVDGRHLFKFVGTGAVVATEWGSFTVRDAWAEEQSYAFRQGLQSWTPAV